MDRANGRRGPFEEGPADRAPAALLASQIRPKAVAPGLHARRPIAFRAGGRKGRGTYGSARRRNPEKIGGCRRSGPLSSGAQCRIPGRESAGIGRWASSRTSSMPWSRGRRSPPRRCGKGRTGARGRAGLGPNYAEPQRERPALFAATSLRPGFARPDFAAKSKSPGAKSRAARVTELKEAMGPREAKLRSQPRPPPRPTTITYERASAKDWECKTAGNASANRRGSSSGYPRPKTP